MTVTHASAPSRADELPGADPVEIAPVAAKTEEAETPTGLRLPSFRRIIVGLLVVIVVFFVAVGAVIYGVGSLEQERISGP